MKTREAAAVPEKGPRGTEGSAAGNRCKGCRDEHAIATAAIQPLTGKGVAVAPQTASKVDVGDIALP